MNTVSTVMKKKYTIIMLSFNKHEGCNKTIPLKINSLKI